MSKQDEKKVNGEQENRIVAQSETIISLLTKRGVLGDTAIDDEKLRLARQSVKLLPTTGTLSSSRYPRWYASTLLCIKRMPAPWLVVMRRMGVKVLTYLKFLKIGEFCISAYVSELHTVFPWGSTVRW